MRLYRSAQASGLPARENKQNHSTSITRSQLLTNRLVSYLQLTKPTIMLLMLVTGGTALVLEGSFIARPDRFLLFLIGLYLTGGAANALNHYFERDIDGRMQRTRNRRPIPTGKLSPGQALGFAIISGVSGVILLGVVFNLLTAALSFITILFYGLIYTLWLKPNTAQNIIIGGIAGAMAPIGAWTAATGTIGAVPVIMSAIVFFWTPPHFWALAIRFRDDYQRVELPMMPVVRGIDYTLRRIFYYCLILTAVSFSYVLYNGGLIYLVSAAIFGYVMIRKAWVASKRKDDNSVWGVFTFSIIYLFGLFMAMVVDKIVVGSL
jgi:protoheme IX farnesyltransferase